MYLGFDGGGTDNMTIDPESGWVSNLDKGYHRGESGADECGFMDVGTLCFFSKWFIVVNNMSILVIRTVPYRYKKTKQNRF